MEKYLFKSYSFILSYLIETFGVSTENNSCRWNKSSFVVFPDRVCGCCRKISIVFVISLCNILLYCEILKTDLILQRWSSSKNAFIGKNTNCLKHEWYLFTWNKYCLSVLWYFHDLFWFLKVCADDYSYFWLWIDLPTCSVLHLIKIE